MFCGDITAGFSLLIKVSGETSVKANRRAWEPLAPRVHASPNPPEETGGGRRGGPNSQRRRQLLHPRKSKTPPSRLKRSSGGAVAYIHDYDV